VARIKSQLGLSLRPWQEMQKPVRESSQLSLALAG